MDEAGVGFSSPCANTPLTGEPTCVDGEVYGDQVIRMDDSIPPTTLPAIGQTPIRNSDKQRLAFRTGTDSEGWRTVVLWKESARDDNQVLGEGDHREVLGHDLPRPIGRKEKNYAVD